MLSAFKDGLRQSQVKVPFLKLLKNLVVAFAQKAASYACNLKFKEYLNTAILTTLHSQLGGATLLTYSVKPSTLSKLKSRFQAQENIFSTSMFTPTFRM